MVNVQNIQLYICQKHSDVKLAQRMHVLADGRRLSPRRRGDSLGGAARIATSTAGNNLLGTQSRLVLSFSYRTLQPQEL